MFDGAILLNEGDEAGVRGLLFLMLPLALVLCT